MEPPSFLRRRPSLDKRRDVSLPDAASREWQVSPGTPVFGELFETWLHHELISHRDFVAALWSGEFGG
ncbi:MAG TPA: hypothetical protein P5186_21200 [Candidatus Paceibacterota bacterium]|nr:hypothetical protein [Candidatus Paceibacterota bacterium]